MALVLPCFSCVFPNQTKSEVKKCTVLFSVSPKHKVLLYIVSGSWRLRCYSINSKSGVVSSVVQYSAEFCRSPFLYTDSCVYLGHIINSGLTDDADIAKQTRALYTNDKVVRTLSA